MNVTKDDVVYWVKIYTKDLFAYALVKVNQKEIAEDLVQDTFLVACQSYKNFKGNSNEKTWLLAILKNKIADHYRLKYKEQTEVAAEIPTNFFDKYGQWKAEYKPPKWIEEKELQDDPEFTQALSNCFGKLPQKWSAAMHLKFLENDNSKAICRKLEITASNFWQIIHRAKLQLRNCLQINWFNKN